MLIEHSESGEKIPNLSPYLHGIHAPLSGETSSVKLRCIEGEVPPQLNGLFARNSPNPQFAPIGKYHWFDGDGMVHGVKLLEGSAHYSSRYVKTEGLAAEKEAGEALWTGILERPRRRLATPVKDTANTDLIWHNGQLIASWWLSGEPYALSADLETLGKASFVSALPPGATVSAHPKVDPQTNELMFFGYNLFKRPYYHYGVVGADGDLSDVLLEGVVRLRVRVGDEDLLLLDVGDLNLVSLEELLRRERVDGDAFVLQGVRGELADGQRGKLRAAAVMRHHGDGHER